MPVADYKTYCKMMETAYKNHYAFPAINVFSIESIHGVIAGLAEAKSDGIIQVSTGGGEHASGSDVKSAVLGAIALADYTRLMADYYNVNVALHTDHCKASKVESFLIPLIEETEKRRAEGRPNLFNSHMFDGSDVSLEENMEIAKKLLARCAKNEIILEVEAGVVGGEEDGNDNSGVKKEKLYTTPEDMLYVYNNLSEVEDGAFMFAATFGNVHGVYKPGNVQLNPGILKAGQDALKAEHPDAHQRRNP